EDPELSPYALMRGRNLWEMCESNDAANASINNAMAADSRFLMRVILKECGEIFNGIDSLVDVAGGVGGAAAAIAAAFPSLECSVVDLPHVVAKAPSYSNVRFLAGDMFESIPHANAIFLKYVLHDWGDDECIKILIKELQASYPFEGCRREGNNRRYGGWIFTVRHEASRDASLVRSRYYENWRG
ncbi:unnamed protein product, partial [Urochloa humidicola]